MPFFGILNIFFKRTTLENTLLKNKIVLRKNVIITKKTFWEKMKCDVGLMIDNDAGEKRCENKVGLSVTKL